MSSTPSENGVYHVDDPGKIQGRDEVAPNERSLGALRLQRALEALGDTGGTLLLPGAGAGRYARAIAKARPDLDIVAGDLSTSAVEEARNRGGGPVYDVFDVESMPYPDGHFDAIVFFDLLEHVPSPRRMLAECARVLRPGGILHGFVPLEAQPGTLYRLLERDRPVPIHRWKREHVGHVQRFTRADVLRTVVQSGFEIDDLTHSFHAVGQVHDIVDYWHRERHANPEVGRLPLSVVDAVTRGTFLVTWRLAWLEDRLYTGARLASGVHVTARRRSH